MWIIGKSLSALWNAPGAIQLEVEVGEFHVEDSSQSVIIFEQKNPSRPDVLLISVRTRFAEITSNVDGNGSVEKSNDTSELALAFGLEGLVPTYSPWPFLEFVGSPSSK